MSLLDPIRRYRSTRLERKARELLEGGDFDAALEVARKLEGLRYTGAFEIAALAHMGRGEVEAAVDVLERGLTLAPAVWINWQLLGNCLSDLQRYAEAGSAYARALACPHVWADSVRLNQAILASRQGLHEEALVCLERVQDRALAPQALGAKLRALADLGRHREVIIEANAAIAAAEEPRGEAWARAAARRLRSEGVLGTDDASLRAHAVEALDQHHAGSAELLDLIRELHAIARDSETGCYRVTVAVDIPDSHRLRADAAGYFVVAHVAANSPDEAFVFARELEGPDLAPNATLESCEPVEPFEGTGKGVYHRTGRIFYKEKA